MTDEAPKVEIDPILCGYCSIEIAEGEKFIEVKKNLGVKIPEPGKGYVKGIYSEPYWESETEYYHVRHFVFVKERS